MNYWIADFREELLKTIAEWDFLLINDSEARMLSGENNLRKAAAKIIGMGPEHPGHQARRTRRHSLARRQALHGARLSAGRRFRSHRRGRLFRGRLHGLRSRARAWTSKATTWTRTTLRRAVIYGSVMGSFCCERFGVERFRTLTREEIDAPLRRIQRLHVVLRPPARVSAVRACCACWLLSAAVMAAAVAYFYRNGSTLYSGDAEAHLDIARRIMDSRTPGWAQIGTTWLPLPHLLMIPLVRNDWLWRTGLAGAIPSGSRMTLAATFLFAALRAHLPERLRRPPAPPSLFPAATRTRSTWAPFP